MPEEAVDADGAVDAQNAPTAPWKSLRDSHKRPPPPLSYAIKKKTVRLRARMKSDDTRAAYHVAAFRTFLSGRISTFGDTNGSTLAGAAIKLDF
jgi:hypothetical protein